MAKIADVVKDIAAQCDDEVAAASKSISGADECTADQIADIVERVCTNRDHETDAAVRESVRAAMKSKPYEFKPEVVEPAAKP